MRLKILSENRGWLHLFHGTFLRNILNIKKHGLTRGDIDRAHFALSPAQSYQYEDPYALIEVLISRNHHELQDPFINIDPSSKPGDRAQKLEAHYGRENLLSSKKLAKQRRQYNAALSRHTKAQGLSSAVKEVNLPLPVGYSGNPKIVGIYIIQDDRVAEIVYGVAGASLHLNSQIRRTD